MSGDGQACLASDRHTMHPSNPPDQPTLPTQVVINDRVVRCLHLVNASLVNLDFAWQLGANPRLAVHPETGCVPRGERLACELSYNPHAPDKLGDYQISCQVGSCESVGLQRRAAWGLGMAGLGLVWVHTVAPQL